MTRLGWWLLLLFLGIIALFVVIVKRGPGAGSSPPIATNKTSAPADAAGGLTIPVAGVRATQLVDNWGEGRADGSRQHHAIDIPAPQGTPVLAAAAGTIEKLFESTNGGHTIYVRTAPATIQYYAHLDGYAPDLREGIVVVRGQPIGTVGSTGDASPTAPHLHFEIKQMVPGGRWWQGQEINPYPLLRAAG